MPQIIEVPLTRLSAPVIF